MKVNFVITDDQEKENHACFVAVLNEAFESMLESVIWKHINDQYSNVNLSESEITIKSVIFDEEYSAPTIDITPDFQKFCQKKQC